MRSGKRNAKGLIGLIIAMFLFVPVSHTASRPASSNSLSQTPSQDRSPQGTQRAINGRVAYASNVSGNYEIYLVNGDGTDPVQLTSNGADDLDPTFSPDGRKIAFITNRDGNFEIYVMNADGSTQTRLTNTAGNEYDPSWSPGGTKIAF